MSAFFASDEWQVLLDNLPNLPFATWESFYATVFSTLLALAVGLPEAYLPLAEAVILLATSPKSNSAMCAYQAALEDIHAGRGTEMPSYLRDAHFAAGAQRGKAYRYPHDYPNGYVRQQYLPDELKDRVYYRFGRNRTEQAAREYRERLLREADGKAGS